MDTYTNQMQFGLANGQSSLSGYLYSIPSSTIYYPADDRSAKAISVVRFLLKEGKIHPCQMDPEDVLGLVENIAKLL